MDQNSRAPQTEQPNLPQDGESPSPPTTDVATAADANIGQAAKAALDEHYPLTAEAAAKEAQRQQLVFFAAIAEGEQRLIGAVISFFEGLPETHMLGQRSEGARLRAIEAAKTLHPMLGIAVAAMKAQADAA